MRKQGLPTSLGTIFCGFIHQAFSPNALKTSSLIGIVGVSLLLSPIAYPEKLSPSVQRQIKSGQAHYNKGYINKALPAFKRALKTAPRSETANLWMAKALIKQGGHNNHTQAKKHLTQVLEDNPNQAEAMILLGEILGWQPDSRHQAIGLLKQALALQKESPQQHHITQDQINHATRTLVQMLSWNGNYPDAAHYAQEIRETYAHEKSWQATYANLLSHVGQAPVAIELYDTYIHPLESKEFSWQLDYIYALTQVGQREKALTIFKTLQPRLMESGNQPIIQTAASLAYDLGLFEASIQLDKALSQNTQNQRETRLRHGRALKQVSRHPEAIEEYYAVYLSQEMLSNEKLELADYLNSLRLTSAELPEPNLIETLYQQVLEESQTPGEIHLRLARLYTNDNNSGESFASATRSFENAYLQFSKGQNPQQAHAVKKEFMDFIKSRPGQGTDATFRRLVKNHPQDVEIQGHYAEYLSWQEPRRKEAIQLYLKLSVEAPNPQQQKTWTHHMDEVLGWHTPEPSWLALYNEILSQRPQNRGALLAKARALASQPETQEEALSTYQILKTQYPDDPEIAREWVGLLTADGKSQKEALVLLKNLTEQYPDDVSAKVAYGKLLSYRTRYRQALKQFDSVLAENPEHKDALIGKSYTLLWSGKKFKAKRLLQELQSRYPDDVSVLLALASVHKDMGRHDKALEILQRLRSQAQKHQPQSYIAPSLFNNGDNNTFIPCANPNATNRYSRDNLTFDFALPSGNAYKKLTPKPRYKAPLFAPYSTASNTKSQHKPLTASIRSVKREPTPSFPTLSRLRALDSHNHSLSTLYKGYGQSALTSKNDSLSNNNRPANSLSNTQLQALEGELFSLLRPEIRSGYGFQFQNGERTTNELFSWSLPNQISVYLTPQLKTRIGINPQRFYLPNSPTRPRSNFGVQYTVGATAQYWDRLRLDGDLGLTHFTQSGKNNVTYKAQAKIQLADGISMRIGGRRNTLANSLLAVAGFKPSQGAFAGQQLGPVNENAFFIDLSTQPLGPIDFNLGYEWAAITGSDEIPNNFKNQFYTSLGYTHRFNPKHSLRAGYDFLYFTFSKNATNGFFDVESSVRSPLAVLRPVIRADSGFDFGGYFSPDQFFLNSFRLDYRGSVFNKFLEYKIGGSLGVQAFEHGFGIQDSDPTSLSSAFNIALKMNFTDSLAAYGRTNFMDSGGVFSRWRFEAGLILRPNIKALTPWFSRHKPQKPDQATVDRNTFPDANFDDQNYKFYN